MAYSENELLRQGYVPTGTRPRKIDPYGNPITESRGQTSARLLSGILDTLSGTIEQRRQQEEKKAEKVKKQFDMYKVLRESGYDPKAAYDAVQKNQLPPAAPSEEPLEEQKKRAELGLTKAKTTYYQQGGAKRTVIDQMTPNQLQSRLKFLTDPLNVQEGDEEETAQEIVAITKKLRGMTVGETKPSATESPSAGYVIMTAPDGKKYKIPKENIEKAKQRGFLA